MSELSKILENMAANTKNAKVRENLKEIIADEKEKEKRAKNDLVGRYIMDKILDLLAVALLIGVIIIVWKLFNESLFEGFISAIFGFWIVRWVFLKRSDVNGDYMGGFSTFKGWF